MEKWWWHCDANGGGTGGYVLLRPLPLEGEKVGSKLFYMIKSVDDAVVLDNL